MQFTRLKPSYRIWLLIAVCALPSLADAGEALPAYELRPSPSSHPAAETLFVPSLDQAPKIVPEPAWYDEPGARKGLIGSAVLDEEVFVAPDIAVLDRGFSTSWPALIAESREPVVLVRAAEIAGLSQTRRLLIIPSGALSHTSGSNFFKAGLAEFAAAGGIVLCMSQRTGNDFSALPVPPDQRLEASGWQEESAPLFRASVPAVGHPLFESVSARPAMETHGFFTAWPASAQPLLVRPDGFPSIIAYPYQKGWVVVTTLFTDFSLLLGSPEPEEKIFIRNILDWAKNPGAVSSTPVPGALPRANRTPGGRAPSQQTTEPSSPPRIRAHVVRKGDQATLSLEIPSLDRLLGQAVLLRSGGSEKTITVTKGGTRAALEVPVTPGQTRMSYALYDAGGRSLARSSLAVPEEQSEVAPERSSYFPEETVVFAIRGMGNGEVMIGAFGYLDNQIIAEAGNMQMQAPDRLPAGTYRADWKFHHMQGNEKTGFTYLDLAGYRTDVREVSPVKISKRSEATASFTIEAEKAVSGRLRLVLRSPDGMTMLAAEPVLSLSEGLQTVPISFPFKPEINGVWELLYTFEVTLPPGDGIPEGPVVLISGSFLLDAGQSAVLAIVLEKPLLYDVAGPVPLAAILAASKNSAKVSVHLDGKLVSSEKVDLEGITHYRSSLPQPGPGMHTVRVSLEPAVFLEKGFANGLNLPDIAVTVRAGDPTASPSGPVLPVTMLVRNSGKSTAGKSRVVLVEEESAAGKVTATIDVPELSPGDQRELAYAFPLSGMAGTRTLRATVDADNQIAESNKRNNLHSLSVNVPDVLLLPVPGSPVFDAGDPVAVDFTVYNLSRSVQTDMQLDALIRDSLGSAVGSETVPIAELAPETAKRVSVPARMKSPFAGIYSIDSRLTKKSRLLASARSGFSIKPTLLLAGSLEKTASNAVLCRPFTIHYSIISTGNIIPSSGTIGIEILSPADSQKTLYRKTFPFNAGRNSFTIESIGINPGEYSVRLTASVSNDRHAVSREFKLAERHIAVTGPVTVRRANALFPRVLVWLGTEARKVEQVLSESIVKQAFEQENLYYRVVDSEEKFSGLARTGIFNTYVLIEPREMPAVGLLQERIERGDGVVVTGSGEFARRVIEQFGFSLDELPSRDTPSLIGFTEDIGLSGTMPLSGKAFSPSKRGAESVALFSPGGNPAALLEEVGKGKLLVLPVSLSRSAYQGGAPALYSLVLRRMALFLAPKSGQPEGAVSGALSVMSSTGPINTVITKPLAAGDRVVWTNRNGSADQKTISFKLSADTEPATLLYLYQPSKAELTPPEEVFFECNGKMVSQGNVE